MAAFFASLVRRRGLVLAISAACSLLAAKAGGFLPIGFHDGAG